MLTFKFKSVLLGSACALCFAIPAIAESFNIPGGDLENALNIYVTQTGVHLIVSEDAIKGIQSRGVKGDLPTDQALSRILAGSGFTVRNESGVLAIVRGGQSSDASDVQLQPMQLAQAVPPSRAIETVTVTSSKLGGADVQSIPIAITALSQEQLTFTQTAGGPDLVKQVPNLTFTKTNFSGYSIQIRGIGTQAISVTTDPAVAVAFNDVPFIRNHFFEQGFYDVSQAEVLRGPQGTLYGRNATAGVVNMVSAKPTDQFEAVASADIGNYKNRRFEGMINLPLIDDRLDLRIAGEWTKRNGYSVNGLTGNPIDGRDLWSSRVTLGWKPVQNVQAYLVWEHFQENDDRMRTSKQLCKTDPGRTEVDGVPVTQQSVIQAFADRNYLSQGCLPTGLYSPDAFEVPNGQSLPYYEPLAGKNVPVTASNFSFDPYASTTQSRDLRVIESTIDPIYKAKNDVVELNVDYQISPALTVSSQTSYNQDFLWSTEDYNRFNTAPGAFEYYSGNPRHTVLPEGDNGVCNPDAGVGECAGLPQGSLCSLAGAIQPGQDCIPIGIFCDPQLGCSDRLVAQDLNDEKSWQFSQELRVASKFSGPFNFSVGANLLHYETEENYYVFINSLTLAAFEWTKGTSGATVHGPDVQWIPGVSDNSDCISGGFANTNLKVPTLIGVHGNGVSECMYIDPNPIENLNNQGHNYFLSQNPYVLNSYAGFGEAYYNVSPELKLTGGLRWTDDKKHFFDIPSQLLAHGYGYPVSGIVDQTWQKFTGRFATNWTPKLDFTNQTLVYASYSRGYKAGGANPPGAILLGFAQNDATSPIHPLTFKPEFINAYELGSKNTLLDGALTLNGDVFFYDYTGYQISRIVDRTAINDNFDATVKGAELEATYEPAPGLKFRFAGGYEHTRIKDGQSSIDLVDRADMADHPDWIVIKPFVTQASNCILPAYVVAALIDKSPNADPEGGGLSGACNNAYASGLDPVTLQTYQAGVDSGIYPLAISGNAVAGGLGVPITYSGFDPSTAPNTGEGWSKKLGGNELPNSPPFTISASVDYTVPLTPDWAGTAHIDYYWQDYSWARVFNDDPYDRLRGYTNINLALILTSQNGWQVMGYLKNVFNTTDITGDFLNSDDSGLTTNVFLTDPRLFGVRVTKNW
jgi:outer membrane receptor protein involved in Fe transport